jgi:hypothetical protein
LVSTRRPAQRRIAAYSPSHPVTSLQGYPADVPSVYRGPKCRQQVQEWCLARLGEWSMPHHRREISTAAGATSVVAAGPDPAAASPTVVLVPGMNTNGAVYKHIAEKLAA